jgi:hypothetical protein
VIAADLRETVGKGSSFERCRKREKREKEAVRVLRDIIVIIRFFPRRYTGAIR